MDIEPKPPAETAIPEFTWHGVGLLHPEDFGTPEVHLFMTIVAVDGEVHMVMRQDTNRGDRLRSFGFALPPAVGAQMAAFLGIRS